MRIPPNHLSLHGPTQQPKFLLAGGKIAYDNTGYGKLFAGAAGADIVHESGMNSTRPFSSSGAKVLAMSSRSATHLPMGLRN